MQVLYNGVPAGVLKKSGRRYSFTYLVEHISNGGRPISITMPLRDDPYESDLLFPVFTNLLSEGVNKKMQCRMLKIDENDYFGLLLATAKEDSIGPLTVKELKDAS
ncbi:MAG: HipA N-terminal domain-containing protein [Ginsengibacter sp.]